MKQCSKCKTVKEFSCFSTSKKTKDGKHSWCNQCCRSAAAARYKENPEKHREIARRSSLKQRKLYPEKAKAAKLKWQRANPELQREIDRRAALKYSRVHPERRRAARHKWKRNNRDAVRAHKRFYVAAKRGHQPEWADNEAIRLFYAKCPKGFHVDHVIPLRGKTVSGLHVETNLQYLPARDNCRKGNRMVCT